MFFRYYDCEIIAEISKQTGLSEFQRSIYKIFSSLACYIEDWFGGK